MSAKEKYEAERFFNSFDFSSIIDIKAVHTIDDIYYRLMTSGYKAMARVFEAVHGYEIYGGEW